AAAPAGRRSRLGSARTRRSSRSSAGRDTACARASFRRRGRPARTPAPDRRRARGTGRRASADRRSRDSAGGETRRARFPRIYVTIAPVTGNPEAAARVPLRALGVLCASWLLCFVPRGASAHPVPFSYLDLRLQQDTIDGSLVVHMFDAGHDLNVEPPDRLLDTAVARQRAADLTKLFTDRLTGGADGHGLTPQWFAPQTLPDRQSLLFPVRFALANRPGVLTVSARMFPYDPQHQTFINIYEGEALTQAILDGGKTRLEYFAGTRQGALAVIQRFLPAGVPPLL